MPKILIIEDEEMLSDMYFQKFKQEGYQVLVTDGAEEGFELAKKEKPDIVLLDILLPQQSGIYFLEKIKQDEETKDLKVVAFSNFDNPKTRQQVEDLGAIAYLLKTNYTPQEVVDKVRKYLKP